MFFNKRWIFVWLFVIAIFVIFMLGGIVGSFSSGRDPYFGYDSRYHSNLSFNGWETLTYYRNYLQNRFSGYPWVVRISDFIIIFSILFTLIFSINTLYSIYKKRYLMRLYKKLYNQYYGILKEICQSKTPLSSQQIRERMEYTPPKRMPLNLLNTWVRLFLTIRFDLGMNYSQHNIRESLKAIEMRKYVTEVIEGSNEEEKYYLMQFLMLLNIIVPESFLLRLKSSQDRSLRKLSNTYSMMASIEEPYSNFSIRDIAMYDCTWDKMELHHYLQFMHHEKRQMPPFISILNVFEGTDMEAFFVEETAYWGNDEEVIYLKRYFSLDSDCFDCRLIAFKSMGIRRFASMEGEMMKIYDLQGDEARRVILKAILKIDSGKAVEFLGRAYRTSASESTQRLALYCLFMYNDAGKALFYELKQQAPDEKRVLFGHVENPIINRNMAFY